MAMLDEAAKLEKINKAYALAYEYEQKYGACPQCVTAAIQEVFGIIDDETFKASYVLAGGGGLTTQGTCGALAGALMAIGAKCGRDKANFDKGQYMDAYRYARDIMNKFVAEYGSPICAEVQKKVFGRSFDLWNSKEFKAFEEAGGHKDKCPAVAGTAAKLAAELLVELEEKNVKHK